MKRIAKVTSNQSKTCVFCEEDRDLIYFSPLKTGLLGVHSTCKPCRSRQAKDRAIELKQIQELRS